jgi:hypothetical protein
MRCIVSLLLSGIGFAGKQACAQWTINPRRHAERFQPAVPFCFNAFLMPNKQEEALSGRQWLGWGMFALLLASYSLKTVVRNRDWANGMHRRT